MINILNEQHRMYGLLRLKRNFNTNNLCFFLFVIKFGVLFITIMVMVYILENK